MTSSLFPDETPAWWREKVQRKPKFDGPGVEAQDEVRLSGQLERVYRAMADGRWRTLRELADEVGGSEASVSARLRDLRKDRFGRHQVERRRVAGGLFQYRVG